MAAKADNGPTAISTSGAESALPQLLACRLLQLYSSKMVGITVPLVVLLKYARRVHSCAAAGGPQNPVSRPYYNKCGGFRA
jgi:hypothetical protein